ncbi:unnamed protein product, partial [Amoebophrya sp. A25]|eukprot:GSA25T00023458001.1
MLHKTGNPGLRHIFIYLKTPLAFALEVSSGPASTSTLRTSKYVQLVV